MNRKISLILLSALSAAIIGITTALEVESIMDHEDLPFEFYNGPSIFQAEA